MPPVLIATFIFSNIPLDESQITSFRKGISSLVSRFRPLFKIQGIPTDYFHNHDEDTGDPINRYPLIQYKILQGKAAITGIGEGEKALQFFIHCIEKSEEPLFIYVGERTDKYEIKKPANLPVVSHIYETSGLKALFEYSVENWLPMDDDRLKFEWNRIPELKKRIALLEDYLQGHLFKLFKATGYLPDVPVKLFITSLREIDSKKEFHFYKFAFDVTFCCNISLPSDVGIGQVPSIGFGILKRI